MLLFTRYRALRTSHICAFTGRSQRVITRATLRLRDSRHLVWIDPEGEDGRKSNPEDILALGDEGAKYVAKLVGDENPKLRRAELNRALKQVAHTMLISDFMVAVELACRASDTVRFIPYTEVLARAPDKKRASKFPLRLTAPIDYRGSPDVKTTVPDQLFGLEFSDKRPPKNRHYFFLEADRSTMTQERILGMKSEDLRSIKRKMLVYYGYRRDRFNESEWGIDNFRVLFLTGKSEERFRHMIANNESVPPDGGGWNQFHFAYKKDLFKHPDLLTAPWTDGEGRGVSFVAPPKTKGRASEFSPTLTPSIKSRVPT